MTPPILLLAPDPAQGRAVRDHLPEHVVVETRDLATAIDLAHRCALALIAEPADQPGSSVVAMRFLRAVGPALPRVVLRATAGSTAHVDPSLRRGGAHAVLSWPEDAADLGTVVGRFLRAAEARPPARSNAPDRALTLRLLAGLEQASERLQDFIDQLEALDAAGSGEDPSSWSH